MKNQENCGKIRGLHQTTKSCRQIKSARREGVESGAHSRLSGKGAVLESSGPMPHPEYKHSIKCCQGTKSPQNNGQRAGSIKGNKIVY